MQRGKGRRGACRRGGAEELGEGAASAVEALEQGGLASVGGSEVGGEGSTSLLKSGSGPLEVRLALGVWWLRSAWRAGPRAGALVVSAAGKVRSQGSTSVGPLWGDRLARVRLSLGLTWCGGRAVGARRVGG